ncbi:MAG TPA: hypothetical protein VK750_07325 [Cytophagaceae bacterium]|jgi:hypothetical protein|nr:hypothetical protein [Cytophagaceae bacterium]
MGYIGTLSFQANDNTDVFLVTDITSSGFDLVETDLIQYETEDLDSGPEWVSGRIQSKIPVTVEGDTSVLTCVFKTISPTDFNMTIYLEYEETEGLIAEEPQEEQQPSLIL